jgi:hypothetical protein
METNPPLQNIDSLEQGNVPAPNTPVSNTLPPPIPELVDGSVPAVLVPPVTEELLQAPAVDALLTNFDKLFELGLDVYEAQDLSTVVYNPTSVSEQQLQEAEANGTLAELAMPLMGDEGGLESAATAAPPAGGPLAGASVVSPAARAANMQPPQVSPIQPNPISQQLARRAV